MSFILPSFLIPNVFLHFILPFLTPQNALPEDVQPRFRSEGSYAAVCITELRFALQAAAGIVVRPYSSPAQMAAFALDDLLHMIIEVEIS